MVHHFSSFFQTNFRCPHANYVLQKVVSHLSIASSSFVSSELRGSVVRVAKSLTMNFWGNFVRVCTTNRFFDVCMYLKWWQYDIDIFCWLWIWHDAFWYAMTLSLIIMHLFSTPYLGHIYIYIYLPPLEGRKKQLRNGTIQGIALRVVSFAGFWNSVLSVLLWPDEDFCGGNFETTLTQ